MLSSKQKLKEAEKLYEEKKYSEALQLLNELEHENPGEKKVAYGRAMCLARLGNFADAMLLCDELWARYRDEKAKVLKEKIMVWAEEASALPHATQITPKKVSVIYLIWQKTKRVLCFLLFLLSLGMPFIGWWGLMIAINKNWFSVSLEMTLAFAIFWPLFFQIVFWTSLQGARAQSFGDTALLSFLNWLADISLLPFLNLFPIIGWLLGAWWLMRKRELSFSSSFVLMVLNHFMFWLSFLGIVGSIGIGGWAWILAPIILRI
ncbi:MAG TPA: tetratricopeptide repeat protein [Candidatus Hydrogenedens sp.]|nr:tetratricopeptide repeat protein [Candidatus Hydrogenedens sp.]HOK08936.1 tetratricopeptide repeat protein [Candidatus Hydrogenedens sp.]HOL19735.1 tetratricopeptide repeat protein [Candidatus Hydrogenedens sp.]HPP58758.1 tetratricopeptide repeat protein [Candidatus Hydrogenedens sp.]